MDNRVPTQIFVPFDYIADDVECFLLPEAALLGQMPQQIPIAAVLGHDEALRGRFVHVVALEDIGVIEGLEDLDLV